MSGDVYDLLKILIIHVIHKTEAYTVMIVPLPIMVLQRQVVSGLPLLPRGKHYISFYGVSSNFHILNSGFPSHQFTHPPWLTLLA